MSNWLDTATKDALDEVIQHSNTRTGAVARAIEAGLIAINDGSVLTERHLQSLHEWASMVSDGGVGDRWRCWRDAVMALLQAYETVQRRGTAAMPNVTFLTDAAIDSLIAGSTDGTTSTFQLRVVVDALREERRQLRAALLDVLNFAALFHNETTPDVIARHAAYRKRMLP